MTHLTSSSENKLAFIITRNLHLTLTHCVVIINPLTQFWIMVSPNKRRCLVNLSYPSTIFICLNMFQNNSNTVSIREKITYLCRSVIWNSFCSIYLMAQKVYITFQLKNAFSWLPKLTTFCICTPARIQT